MNKQLRSLANMAWNSILNNPNVPAQMKAAKFPYTPKILGTSTKIVKGEKKGILTAVAYLSPADEAGVNMCPWATAECILACLGHSSGRLTMNCSKNARVWKTALFTYAREVFMKILHHELKAHEKKALKNNLEPAIRLNGTSDVIPAWKIAEFFPNIFFYDYSKNPKRAIQTARGLFPKNYHVTLSRSGENDAECIEVLKNGGNVAVVYATKKAEELPESWNGFPTLDADEMDARYHDPRGHVSALTFKGNKLAVAGKFAVQISDRDRLLGKHTLVKG